MDLLSKRPNNSAEILSHFHEKDIDSLNIIARDINILMDLRYDIEAPIINNKKNNNCKDQISS